MLLKLVKKIGPGLLRTGILLMLLMLMMPNPTLILSRTVPSTKTMTVVVCPMMMISELIQMETCGDENVPNSIEDEIGNAEENHTKTIALLMMGETIRGEWTDYILTVQ